jgi:hypothetical protein
MQYHIEFDLNIPDGASESERNEHLAAQAFAAAVIACLNAEGMNDQAVTRSE